MAVSCSGTDDEDDENAFVLRSTGLAVAPTSAPPIGDGDFLAFLVSEGSQGVGGTDFNEDSDLLDDIAVRVDTATRTTSVLDIAAEEIAFSRRTLFLSVSEADDNFDWNGDSDALDQVLLYVTPDSTTAVYYDDLAAGGDLEIIGGTVIYASAMAPTLEFDTNLKIANVPTSGAAPDPPMAVLTSTDPNTDGVSFDVTGSDGDIVFLAADETVDGDLNGDSDATDTSIFAVLDAGAASPEALMTGLAIAPASRPTAVPVSGGGEWLIAFLVDEVSEGVSLNDPSSFSSSWAVAGCADPDTDTDDFVLHWFQLTDLAMNTAPVVNTGLIGEANGVAYALQSQFVGVVSAEDQQGSGTCNMNGDGDELDDIFRWVAASNPADVVLPVTTTSMLIAIDRSVPGGSGGVVRLADAWVIVVDESADDRDYDTQAGTDRELIIVHNPTQSSQAWNALHGTAAPFAPVSTTWMADDPDSTSRFYATFREETLTINPGGLSDINDDGDTNDAVPTTPRIVEDNRLTFPGIGTASDPTRAGIVAEQNVGYFRVSEAAEGNMDLNGNGQTNDIVLQRYELSNQFPRTFMGTCNTLSTPAVQFAPGTAEFGAFLFEEAEQGTDQNGDGDTADFVVRYFRLP